MATPAPGYLVPWTPPTALVELVRRVTRGFYGPMHYVIVQHLLVKDSIREDDFFVLLKLSKQQCMIWIGELLAAKVLGQDTRDDKPIADGVILTEYQRRARKLTTYYYIDYLGLVNSVRYRLLEVPKRLEKLAKQRSDVAKYKCPDCESVFNALEHINDLMDLAAGDLLCLHCKTPVKELRNENAINENSVSRFHQQMHDIQKLLEQVPANIPARILTPARPADPDDPTAQGRAASRQVALSADNAGAGLRKGNRPLDLNLWAHATFDVRLEQPPDAVVPRAVSEGALPPYCASYLITNAMARLYQDDDAEALSDSDEERAAGPDEDLPNPYDGLSVAVQGRNMALKDITPEDECAMTEAEYNAYFGTAVRARVNYFRLLEEREREAKARAEQNLARGYEDDDDDEEM